MLILLLFIALKTKVRNIGFTQILIEDKSSVEVILDQPNTSSYLFFSDVPPNNTYIFTDKEKVYLNDRYMFISDENINLQIEKPTTSINLSIWIIPSNICSKNARIFKTNQVIFTHWVFTNELKQLCYFPLNNAEAEADITILSPKRLKVKSSVIIYSSNNTYNLYAYKNLTETQKIGPYNIPFFISLQDASPGTVFAYDIHFSKVIEDVCIDEPFQYFNKSSNSFRSTFSAVEEPSNACTNEEDNKKIIRIIILLVIVLILLIIIGGIVMILIIRLKPKNKERKYM